MHRAGVGDRGRAPGPAEDASNLSDNGDSLDHEPPDPVVSVIIPSYRSGTVVGDAIRSVLNQTRRPDEIIVVDDGSPRGDRTAEVCADVDAVRYIRRRDNGGASAARNTGIAAARGNYVAFLDADDLWDPEKLEQQLAALAKHPDAAFSVTASLVGSPDGECYRLYKWEGPLDPDVMRAELLVRNIFTGSCSSLVVRREALESAGRFPSGKASEDRRVMLALLERFQGVILDAPLIRQRSGPAHWTDPERHRIEMRSIIHDHADLYRRLDRTGLLIRRARAKMHDRTGMHYLENGDLKMASRDLIRAALWWPLLPNPWRVLVNACLGRLRMPRRMATASPASGAGLAADGP